MRKTEWTLWERKCFQPSVIFMQSALVVESVSHFPVCRRYWFGLRRSIKGVGEKSQNGNSPLRGFYSIYHATISAFPPFSSRVLYCRSSWIGTRMCKKEITTLPGWLLNQSEYWRNADHVKALAFALVFLKYLRSLLLYRLLPFFSCWFLLLRVVGPLVARFLFFFFSPAILFWVGESDVKV